MVSWRSPHGIIALLLCIGRYAEDNKSKLHHNPNYQVEKEVIRYLLTSASNSSSSGTGSNASSKSTLLKRATNCIACSSMNGILLQIFTSTEDAARYRSLYIHTYIHTYILSLPP